MSSKSYFFLLAFLGFIACDGKASTESGAPHPSTAPTSAPSNTQSAYNMIDRIIQDPKVLRMNWNNMSKAFPKLCTKVGSEPEVICPPIEGLQSISVLSSGTGLIDLVFTHPINCEDIYAVVVKRFGAGKQHADDKCQADWNLNHLVKGAYIRLSKSRKQADKIFFQFAVEQGP